MSSSTTPSVKTTLAPSGIEWLGDIPSHWHVFPLLSLFEMSDERNGKNIVGEMLSISGYRGVETKSYESDSQKRTAKQLEDYRVLRENQLAVNTMWLNHAGIAVSELEGHMSPAYRAYNISKDLVPKFAHYLLRSHFYIQEYTRLMQGIRPNSLQIKFDDFKRIPVLTPPKDEQDRIVDFLDQKTAQIDALIEKKQRLLKLLDEQLAIKINNAVTKGIVNADYGTLNPHLSTPDSPVYTTHTSPLKPSNIDWIGDIPEEWEVNRFKFFISPLEQGWSPQCDNRIAEEGEWAVLKVGCVNYARFSPEEHKAIPSNIKPKLDLLIQKGDFLISRANSRELVGSAAIATDSKWQLMLCDKIYRCSASSEKIIPDLAIEILGAFSSRQQIEIGANGASDSMQNISQDVLKNLLFACPSKAQQSTIINFILSQRSLKNQETEYTKRTISALNTLRSNLISQTVTGKITL